MMQGSDLLYSEDTDQMYSQNTDQMYSEKYGLHVFKS
jgi:hypothetical protein